MQSYNYFGACCRVWISGTISQSITEPIYRYKHLNVNLILDGVFSLPILSGGRANMRPPPLPHTHTHLVAKPEEVEYLNFACG